MNVPLFIVDAFTTSRFHGNPAAVCPLPAWLPDSLMQSIAAENNLAETAFVIPQGSHWGLRWFTPTTEVDLCGHATLATAFVLAEQHPAHGEFRFDTRGGPLVVSRQGNLLTLDFPARPLLALPPDPAVDAALGAPVLALTRAAKTLIAELASEASVQNVQPDLLQVIKLDCSGLIATARGTSCDIVSRFFAPKVGVDEDAVTGSAHCGLVPYWAPRLGKTRLVARQLSARGGELLCELQGDRVLMGGYAVLYSKGEIYL